MQCTFLEKGVSLLKLHHEGSQAVVEKEHTEILR